MNFNGERTNSYRFSAAYRAFTGRILQRCRELRKRKAHICEGGCAPPKSFRKLVLPVYSADMHVFSHSLARHAVCVRNCCGHSASRVVARASRPCESCNRHTGETPVPLPFENQ